MILVITSHVDAVFAGEFASRPDSEAVDGFVGEELLESGAAAFYLLGRGPTGGFTGGFVPGECGGFVEEGLAEVGERGFEDGMVAVGEKTVRIQPNPKPLDHLGQGVEKPLAVLVVAEYVAAFIAAGEGTW